MTIKDRILKATRLSCFCFLCINLVYFAIYAILFAGDYTSAAQLFAGGPNAKMLFTLPACLLICFLCVFLCKKKTPLCAVLHYFGNVAITFTFLFIFFLCVHFVYLDCGGSADIASSYILLSSTSFRLLGSALLFSVLLPFLNMLLHAETYKLSIRFLLHGAAIIFLLTVFNIVFFNGFSSASTVLLFLIIAVLIYTVFATVYASWNHHRSVQQEKDYKRVFRKN